MASSSPFDTQKDLGRTRRSPDSSRPFLFVVLHLDQPLAGGARHALDGIDEVVIGRGGERAALRSPGEGPRRLELRLPGSFISSSHARIYRDGSDWVLEDHVSLNGCFINGERITRAPLHDQDLIGIGHTLLRFRRALPTPPGTPEDLDTSSLAPPAPGLVTLLPQLEADFAAIARIARTPVPVLLLGETGAGKEVMARAIHAVSGRPGAFVAVNCGALTGSLVESLLFGHVKGAFTGAVRSEPGFVRSADRGTLFLDEIGDLPLPAQAALLRVLQEREVVPVGATRPLPVDLRIVAATHRALDKMAARGEFRSDLLARLSGYRHQLWPLRERREDLGLLVSDLLRREPGWPAAELGFSPAAGQLLLRYDWPLNIRELYQCLSVSSALASGGVIEAAHLPEPLREAPPPRPRAVPGESDELRDQLVLSLVRNEGIVSQVAREMGKTRTQIHRWLQRFGLSAARFRK